jgi:hypothetical protein
MKMFSDNEKFKMNKAARAIVKGQVVCAFVLGAFLGALPSSAKADDAENLFKSRNANVPPMEIRNKEWRKLGDQFEIKSKARFGRSMQNHVCDAFNLVCVSSNYYTVKGGFIYIREIVAYENTDKILAREICLLNYHGDIRDCVNFDTGARRRDVLDVRGVWHDGSVK